LRVDQAVRKRTELDNELSSNEESIDNLEKQLFEAKITLSDSESKKLATLDPDVARANTLAEGTEKKLSNIEEELKAEEKRISRRSS
jgi:chromosome segregation ATPase